MKSFLSSNGYDAEENGKSEPEFKDFPGAQRLAGCRFEGTDSGARVEGVIADVAKEEDRVTVFDNEGEVAFGLTHDWGSWYIDGTTLRVHMPLVGTCNVYDVRPA